MKETNHCLKTERVMEDVKSQSLLNQNVPSDSSDINMLKLRIRNLKIEWSKRENNLKKEVKYLQTQLTCVMNERDRLKSQLHLFPSPSKAKLETLMKSGLVRSLQIQDDKVGLVLH